MDNDRKAVFEYFMECGAMVSLTTAAIFDGVVNKDYVVVHSAPPRVMKEIMGFMNMVSLSPQGLLVPLAKKESK